MTINHTLPKKLDIIFRERIQRAVSKKQQEDPRMDELTKLLNEEEKITIFEQLYDEIQNLFNMTIIETFEAKDIKLTQLSIGQFMKERAKLIIKHIKDITEYYCAEFRWRKFSSDYDLNKIKLLTELERQGTRMPDGSQHIPLDTYKLIQVVSAEIQREQECLLTSIKNRFMQDSEPLSKQQYR